MGKIEEGSKRYEARVWNAEEKGALSGKGENTLHPSLAIRKVTMNVFLYLDNLCNLWFQ